jgi:RecB family exonuclease
VRVADLHQFRQTLAELSSPSPPHADGAALAVVPSRSAGLVFEETVFRPRSGALFAGTALVTRDEMYAAFHRRLASPPRLLTPAEREVIALAAAHETAAAGDRLPFQVRPGLVAEMLRFYDHLRRQQQVTSRFEELITAALGGSETDDRGAQRLLLQTAFLAGTFTAYERRVASAGALDEHGLRERLCQEAAVDPIRHVIVTVPDWIADPDGLFAADFDLLTRIPGLESLDILCTSALLASGFHERIHTWWPGLDEVEGATITGPVAPRKPLLVRPLPGDDEPLWFTYRDREEELLAIARRVRAGDPDGARRHRTAVVYKRPLPYLYLAPDTLGAAGVDYQTFDALPLAAEPLAATIDLIFDAVESDFSRSALVALLQSPFIQWSDADALARADVALLNSTLSAARYLGGAERLDALASAADPKVAGAFAVARLAVAALAPFALDRPASEQLDALGELLGVRCRVSTGAGFDDRERAVLDRLRSICRTLADAHRAHYDMPWRISDMAAAVRRAIGSETFEIAQRASGLYLLDDQAARFGDFDDLTVVGLIEGEWPERLRRNIFYSSTVMRALGWPSEKDRRAADAARFLDLLASPARHVELSTFLLDDEAIVTRSVQLDDVPAAKLSTVARTESHPDVPPATSGWDALRRGRSDAASEQFHGVAGPRPSRPWSVSALEAYLACPFKFYAQHVLRLEEEPDDEEVMDPRRQGQLVHEVFELFFRRWQAAGHGAITATDLPVARDLFAQVVEEVLQQVPEAEAGLERTRLLGSPAAAGLGEAVFRMEAERPTAVVERLLEHEFNGSFEMATSEGMRRVELRGKADRIDLLADGTFRLIDYKLGWPPDRTRALQLPIYARLAEQRLAGHRGRSWTVGEAMYLAFKGPRRVVPLFRTREQQAEIFASAQQRLVDTIDAIERGMFPPSPQDVYHCDICAFAAVCRKDYVGDV